MARVNVFLSDDLLAEAEKIASAEGESRSAFIQKALRSYMEAIRIEKETERRKRERIEAAKAIDRLAERLGEWDPVRLIREGREARAAGVSGSSGTKAHARSKAGRER